MPELRGHGRMTCDIYERRDNAAVDLGAFGMAAKLGPQRQAQDDASLFIGAYELGLEPLMEGRLGQAASKLVDRGFVHALSDIAPCELSQVLTGRTP